LRYAFLKGSLAPIVADSREPDNPVNGRIKKRIPITSQFRTLSP